ncbi:hypothetical protein L4D21_27540, partial [Photobacterium profundum]|uniref:hypothetical protein n=1 Tax=Photobacterium profundum TaxID=74109 RepID=UPI003D0D7E66
TDNYVLLDVSINKVEYKLKRFIGSNEIFINTPTTNYVKKIIRRNGNEIFSDWLLKKLYIEPFELTLGRHSWTIGFNDLYRLMYYDQETQPIKIFKTPSSENFITDSDIIRCSIFETLLGKNSEEYNEKFNDYKEKQLEFDRKSQELSNYCNIHSIDPDTEVDLEECEKNIEEIREAIGKLKSSRLASLEEETSFSIELNNIDEIKSKILLHSRKINHLLLNNDNVKIEKSRVTEFKDDLKFQINQLQKIIFTHDKLSLFSEQICPFCSKEIDSEKQKLCLCGHAKEGTIEERFIYTSSDYLKIHDQKNKKLETVDIALSAIDADLLEIETNLSNEHCIIEGLNSELLTYVEQSTYYGNIAKLTEINYKLNELNDLLYNLENEHNKNKILSKLKDEKEKEKESRDNAKEALRVIEISFKKNNHNTINGFKNIFRELLFDSPMNCKTVSVDNNYMPLIDGGIYKEKSSAVTVRLMYYYTMLL